MAEDEGAQGAEGSAEEHGEGEGEGTGGSDGSDNGEVRDPEAVLAKNKELLADLQSVKGKLVEFEKAAEERRQAEMSEAEKAVEEAEKAGYDRAKVEYGELLLKERVLARATGVLLDPSDAVVNIDLSELDIDDPDSIDKAIEELLKAKPHLKATGRRASIDQGPVGKRVPVSNANDWLRGALGR